MPNVLSLIHRETGKRVEGRDFIALDEDMCAVFGVEPNTVNWVYGWMDCVGFSLAVTNSFDKARETWHDNEKMVRVLDYLETYYTVNAYYSH